MVIKTFNIKSRGALIPVYIATLFLLLLSGNFTGCDPEDWMFEVDCNDCYSYQPDSANLIIYLTMNEENDSVPLIFYKGAYEDGVIDWQDTATSGEFRLYSEIATEYTVRATYKSGQKTIVVFDADKMELTDSGAECGSPCYIVKGGIFDLRLME